MNDRNVATSEKLLREFTRERSEAAFQALVERHLPMVYNTALRVANGDKHLAEDISQIVFSEFASKAVKLPAQTIVAGWLHQHTWFTASKLIRSERRRVEREQHSFAMNTSPTESEGPDASIAQVQPVLDEALTSLKSEDRDAIALRYFERADFSRVGQVLGISEDAAQKRVSRAIEKLRGILSARGISISVAGLISALSVEAAAPVALGKAISVASLSAAIAGTAGVASFFAGTKLKLVTAGAVAALTVPIIWQRQTISKLRAENSVLASRSADYEKLQAEMELLRKQTISSEDVARMNREFMELQRLRGEVTLLRQQLASATSNIPERVDADEAEETADLEPLQVLVEAQVAELTLERMTELLQNGFPAVANPREFNFILDHQPAAELMRLLRESEGVDLLSAPKVTTADGREAQIQVTDELAFPDGRKIPLGLFVNLIPKISPDRVTLDLQTKVWVTEFVGWEPAPEPIPKLRTREATQQAVFASGQMLVMGRFGKRGGSGVKAELGEGAADAGANAEPEPKLQIYCIQPTLINGKGEAVKI
jgi:RNA polymerase sigma factor (sigma-70 family)